MEASRIDTTRHDTTDAMPCDSTKDSHPIHLLPVLSDTYAHEGQHAIPDDPPFLQQPLEALEVHSRVRCVVVVW